VPSDLEIWLFLCPQTTDNRQTDIALPLAAHAHTQGNNSRVRPSFPLNITLRTEIIAKIMNFRRKIEREIDAKLNRYTEREREG
jgi:hypothetical protein